MFSPQHSKLKEELRQERAKSRSYQKRASEWQEKFFAAQRENDKLNREIRKLAGISPGELRRLRQETEEELSRKRDELEALDGLYEAKEKELETKLGATVEQYNQAREDAAKAEAVLVGLKTGIKELTDPLREAERRRRWRTAVWSFILGVMSSIIISVIIILLTSAST